MADLSGGMLALGEEWWVLDNALRLYRELGDKKGRGVLLLRELRTWYRDFPEGSVFARETPDFVVENTNGRRVGLEVTECLRGAGGRRKGSRHRERWATEEKVKCLAENLYYGGLKDNPVSAKPVRVDLQWSPQSNEPERLPESVKEMAAIIARLVRETEPEWRDGRLLEIRPERFKVASLEGVLTKLTVRREAFKTMDGRAFVWTASRSYPTASAGPAEVAASIKTKDEVYDRCMQTCDEAWLIVALGGGDSFQDVDEEVLDHLFRSRFDRLLLLCLDGGPGMRRAFELREA